jgi:hypothetical protein
MLMTFRLYISILAIASATLLFNGCIEEKPEQTESSFQHIQATILNNSCALSGCHASSQDVSFAQHGLILKEGEAYANLVSADPHNHQAHEDGLKRITPGDPEKSLLIHKLHCDTDHHSHDYGSVMPLGLDPLSHGQIEYITKWIEQGAPETGMIDADLSLLDDNVPSCKENFIPLEAPASGTGYQIRIEPFDIKPDFEREIFVYKALNNPEEVYINRVEMKMRRNSHHFLVNTFDERIPAAKIPVLEAVRELRDGNGNYVYPTVEQMEFHVFTIASQTPELYYDFPEGVALKMPANHKLDINLHYVNKSANTIQGECYLNLHAIPASEVAYEAKPIFYSTEDILLEPGQKTIVIKKFISEKPMKVFMLTSHTHKLGERFEIQISGGARNGEVIYTSSDWHHPTIETYDPALELKAGEGLTMVITYNNTTDHVVKFGLKSTDEMGIIFGYYY